ncbi:unnamed protein product [Amoebophrya sp. A120]|nr:unnamed protein product [Amoebophrya sp. A120]|eukprot:GSA120T00023554001.1
MKLKFWKMTSFTLRRYSYHYFSACLQQDFAQGRKERKIEKGWTETSNVLCLNGHKQTSTMIRKYGWYAKKTGATGRRIASRWNEVGRQPRQGKAGTNRKSDNLLPTFLNELFYGA